MASAAQVAHKVLLVDKERVGAVLQRCVTSVVAGWLERAKQSASLNSLRLRSEERTGHVPKLVEDLGMPSPAHLSHYSYFHQRKLPGSHSKGRFR